MNALTIYIWGITDSIREKFGLIFVLSSILLVFALIAYAASKASGDEELNEIKLLMRFVLRTLGIISLTSLLTSTLMPNSKTIAAMVIIPELANSDAVKRDLPEIYDMAIKKLKDELSPQTPEKQ